MNYGPIIFLSAFLAIAASWFGLVLTPNVQLGHMQPTNSIPDNSQYPVSRPGYARGGLDVYRANGCAYCHSQQAQQVGTVFDIAVTEAGTNQAAAVEALVKIRGAATEGEAKQVLGQLPKKVRLGLTRFEADEELKTLTAAGLKADMLVVPIGPDMARGWGFRRSVAEDFLYDSPAMPGSQRIGPDLANVGARQPDANWQLRHLYDPQKEVPGSLMPPYRHLFEKRRMGKAPSPDAVAAENGYEMVPTREASALVAYLQSLRTDTAIFETPMKLAAAAPPAATNAPAGNTNAAAGNTNAAEPAKAGTPSTNAVGGAEPPKGGTPNTGTNAPK
jgi:cbb3-type cytochrome oxidase cytochrome c subunit